MYLKDDTMKDYSEARIHDWWYEEEFNMYCTILETIDGTLRFICNPKEEGKKK